MEQGPYKVSLPARAFQRSLQEPAESLVCLDTSKGKLPVYQARQTQLGEPTGRQVSV